MLTVWDFHRWISSEAVWARKFRRAYAYFTFRRNKVLTEIQQKRLAAIREFTEFGSGFRIAMRDLELRGAGNIMGAQQHGHMESVGYDMYLKLLDEAVSEEKGEQNVTKDLDCLIDISVDADIPESYVESLTLRLDVYRRIADIRSNEDADDVIDELQDRFGNTRTRFSDLSTLPLCVQLTQWVFTKSDRTAQHSCSL